MKIVNNIEKYTFLAFIFAYPLFFLPIFPNVFETSKLLLLTTAFLFLTLLKIIKIIINKNYGISISKTDIWVLFLLISYLLSFIFVSPNKMDALLLPGSLSFIIFGTFLYFFVNQIGTAGKKTIEITLLLSASVASIISIISQTALGSTISTLVILIATLPIAFYHVLRNPKIYLKIILIIMGFIILVATSINFYSLLPNKSTSYKLPDIKTGWEIAIETLKKNPLLGIGPGNFLESFNKFRPLSFNKTANWQSKFFVSTNTPLTIMAEVGVLGILSFLAIFIVSLVKVKFDNPAYFSILLIFIVLLIFPVSPSIMPILLLYISLNTKPFIGFEKLNSKALIILTILFSAILLLPIIYFSFKAFSAEFYFDNAIKSLNQGNGEKTYENMNKSISINHYVDRYHLLAADVNLALAKELAKKKDLNDANKKTITELIQQSIREAKAATALNPHKASNWEALADIYTKISVSTKDANKFAIESYQQAIFLDPINPALRIKLGEIYFTEEKYKEAIKVIELAIVAKNDLPNTHYMLAVTLRKNNEIDKAKDEINFTLKLVDPNSNDYEIASKELQTIESLLQSKNN